MIRTEKQLSEMSDFQVDRDTAIKAFGKDNVKVVQARHEPDVLVLKPGMEHVGFVGFDPTSNWADVMPIAEKYGMVVELSTLSGTKVSHGVEEIGRYIENWNENPKRAICEVFLMMEIES